MLYNVKPGLHAVLQGKVNVQQDKESKDFILEITAIWRLLPTQVRHLGAEPQVSRVQRMCPGFFIPRVLCSFMWMHPTGTPEVTHWEAELHS